MVNMMNVDCMDWMADKPDNYYDLAIVDPPYGIGMASGGRVGKSREYTKKDWDSAVPDDKYFNELFRVSKNQFIWGGNYFDLPPTKHFIIWDKKNAERTFADCEFMWSSMGYVARIFKLHPSEYREERIHPTQKSHRMYAWLLDNYAKEGDKILDTHGGSGSICIACHNLGFDLDWMEIDKEYFDQAVKRFEWHKSQLRMF